MLLAPLVAHAQFTDLPQPDNANVGNVPTPKSGEVSIAEVRIEGHSGATQIGKLPKLNTRAGTPFDPKLIEDDVRALDRTRRFLDIRTRYQQTANGLVVIFQVVEKPVLRYVKYIGMEKVKESKLSKEAGIKAGDALDLHRVEEARRSMETYYHEHGFPDAYVIAAEGTKVGDKGAVFIINEGTKQAVWDTVFEGNQIATDARLRTQIESKHGFLWLFGGEVDPNKIESDVEKLTAYYRGLGFFQAKVGRVLEYDEKGWLTIRFVINEGPRYKVRKISTLGNTKFNEAEMLEETVLLPNEYFDQGNLNRDLMKMRDMYGSQGHIYCDVQADTRFVENEQGQLDIVYKIEEGAVYRVGHVNVEIGGESPHTRQRTVMNRMSLRPGDIVDTRKILRRRNSLAPQSIVRQRSDQREPAADRDLGSEGGQRGDEGAGRQWRKISRPHAKSRCGDDRFERPRHGRRARSLGSVATPGILGRCRSTFASDSSRIRRRTAFDSDVTRRPRRGGERPCAGTVAVELASRNIAGTNHLPSASAERSVFVVDDSSPNCAAVHSSRNAPSTCSQRADSLASALSAAGRRFARRAGDTAATFRRSTAHFVEHADSVATDDDRQGNDSPTKPRSILYRTRFGILECGRSAGRV
ncbi:MAG: POTRA domain-containing protein [Pirellulales bacterium]